MIEWKCLGDEYLLTRGHQRRVVSSEKWWASIQGAAPTQAELETLWNGGMVEREHDTSEKQAAEHAALAKELRTYITETESELASAKAELAAGQGSKEEVRRLEEMLTSVREQLRIVLAELRQMAN